LGSALCKNNPFAATSVFAQIPLPKVESAITDPLAACMRVNSRDATIKRNHTQVHSIRLVSMNVKQGRYPGHRKPGGD